MTSNTTEKLSFRQKWRRRSALKKVLTVIGVLISLVITGILIFSLIVLVNYKLDVRRRSSTYATAVARCGNEPVMVVEKWSSLSEVRDTYLYTPLNADYDIVKVQVINPDIFPLEGYEILDYYCTAAEARAAYGLNNVIDDDTNNPPN